MYFGLDLDDCFEELWHELERVQDGRACHTIAMKACDKTNAAIELGHRLEKFFAANMYPCDQYGSPTTTGTSDQIYYVEKGGTHVA